MFEIVLFVCTLLMITCVPSEVPTSFKSKLGIQNKKGLKINSKINSKIIFEMFYRCWYTQFSGDKTRFSNFLIYPKNNQNFFSELANISKILVHSGDLIKNH